MPKTSRILWHGQARDAQRSPNRLTAQVCADHTRSVRKTSPGQRPVILTSGFRPRRRRREPACSQKLSGDFVAARTRKVSGRERFGKNGQFSEVSKGVIQNDIYEFPIGAE
jgi:hypothetical protein